MRRLLAMLPGPRPCLRFARLLALAALSGLGTRFAVTHSR